ncbi:MAG: methyltransferase [Polyangia bacterium]
MLRVTAPATEIARLGEVLRALVRDDAEGFDALFDPSSPRLTVSGVAPALAQELRAFGLVDGSDDELEGQHRIRRIGERFYVLEIGGTLEYVQDVWPETDALLDVIARAPAGLRVADVGTGSGVLAVEAAARGHRVVATDLYDTALQLARFNAILNGVEVDFRRGHLFEPLATAAFELVVTAPHYGREADQLRLEVFRDGPRVLADGGMLVLASQLEWQGDGPLAVEPLLRSSTKERAMSVRIAPIDSALKRHWHLRAVGDDARLVSRWRFTVAIVNDGRGQFSVERAPLETLPARAHVPLARLQQAPRDAAWTIATGDDRAALSALLAQLAGHELTIDAPLPALVLDACRFGARPCVAPRGQAAGAILDTDGNVRPCTHGEPLARGDDSLATLLAHQQAAAARAYARRGCRDCAVVATCPRCLFPAPFAGEAEYCAFMRDHATTLPRFRRLVETLTRLGRRGGEPPLRVRMWPRTERTAALGSALVEAVAEAWLAAEAWLIELGDTQHLFWMRDGTLHDTDLESIAALVGAAAADGERPPLPDRVIDRGARRLAALLLWK